MFGLNKNHLFVNALMSEDFATAKQLLAKGADPNSLTPKSLPLPVHLATIPDAKRLDFVLSNGGNPIVKAKDQGFPLLRCAANGGLACVQTLIAHHANLNLADHTGLTALMASAFMGQDHVVEELVKAGASVDQQDQEGFTALMFASKGQKESTVALLLKFGANPNARDKDGSTPPMFAGQHGNIPIVRMMIEAGALVTFRGSHGLTLRGFARQNGFQDLEAYLETLNAPL